MWRDGEVRSEESAFLAPKTPDHIGRIRFDVLKINALREENVDQGLAGLGSGLGV